MALLAGFILWSIIITVWLVLEFCLQALLVPLVLPDHLESKVPQELQGPLVRLVQLEQLVRLEVPETEDLLG